MDLWTPRLPDDDATAATARMKLEQVLPESLRRRAAAVALSTQVLREAPMSVDWELVGSRTLSGVYQ